MDTRVIFTTVLLACALMQAGAQSVPFEWAISTGGNFFDSGFSITTNASGNVYVTGQFADTVDFDPGPGTTLLTTQGGSADIFVLKLDASSNLIWARSTGGTGYVHGNSITTDASGNVFVTGSFRDTVDFDPGPGTTNLTSYGEDDIFILKLDDSGNYLWAKSMGGAVNDRGSSIATDAAGNVHVAGWFEGAADFDPGLGTSTLTSAGTADIFVQKLDPFGNFLWAKSIGGADLDRGHSVTTDALGNVYVTGGFMDTIDFDPGPGTTLLTSAGYFDIFVLKLDTSGNLLWAKSIGEGGSDGGSGITTDVSGNVYVTGSFTGVVDFDPGPGITNLFFQGVFDIFVLKLDTSGNFRWAKSMGGTDFDSGLSIATDVSENVYITGFFQNTADFDPGPGMTLRTSKGVDDIFACKLDDSGNFRWAKSMGGILEDWGVSITADAMGNVYVTGGFKDTVDFDPGPGISLLASNGFFDIFVYKLSSCSPSAGSLNLVACASYTSPSGNYIWSTNGTYTDTITNTAGCDSILTINLTINTVDTTVIRSGAILTAMATSATFQWLDCVTGFPVPGATQATFTPEVNGIYAVQVSQNGCTDSSACISITNVGILSNDFGDALLAYPNPTTGHFTIELGKPYPGIALTLRNLHGQLLRSTRIGTESRFEIDIPGPQGIYLIEIRTADGKAAVLKVQKE